MGRMLAVALVLAAPAWARDGGRVTQSPFCERVADVCLVYQHPNHANCGTRGGPGCRKSNGHCAAWRDNLTPSCRGLPQSRQPR